MSTWPRLRTLFLGLILVSISAVLVNGQIPQGMNETNNTHWGGNNYLVGTVFFPDGTRVNIKMNIRLRSVQKGDVLALTDDTGKFVFSGLSSGLYFIVLEDDRDYEPVNQQVEVIQNRSAIPQSYTVSIRLVDKVKQAQKPSILRVADAGIPKAAVEHYNSSVQLSKKGDHNSAIQELRLAIAEYPMFVNAYNELGVQYQKLNDLARAEESFTAALKIKADAIEPMVNRGIVLFRMSRFKEAETALRDAIKVKDQSAVAHFYLGRTLAKLTSYEEAEKELNLAVTIGGTEMNEAHRMLAMMYIDKDDRAKAVASLETYLKLVPNAPDAEKLREAIKQLKGQQ